MDAPVSRLRYVVPNAVTSLSILFAVLGIQCAIRGRPVEAAWWALLPVLTDKADGFLATRLRATSSFGVQLDSLADLVSFGVTPGAILYSFYSTRPQLGWTEGWRAYVLATFAALDTIGAALRLAKFNVGAEKLRAAGESTRHFSGMPTTMSAGILVALFLAILKYSDPGVIAPEALDHWRLLGPLRLDVVLPYLPWLLPLFALGMLSTMRVPKLGRTFSRVTDIILAITVTAGFALGIVRHLPEYLAGGGLWYWVVAVVHTLRGEPKKI